ncbi:hypothetical protein JNW88_27865, partial [Micromonospora sp. ATA32]|nr:hypothetical protein [Micromonospora sp. ATA32]
PPAAGAGVAYLRRRRAQLTARDEGQRIAANAAVHRDDAGVAGALTERRAELGRDAGPAHRPRASGGVKGVRVPGAGAADRGAHRRRGREWPTCAGGGPS